MSEQEGKVYPYSIKIEMTAKGLSMPTVHVFNEFPDAARKTAVDLYLKTIADLKAAGQQVASEVKA